MVGLPEVARGPAFNRRTRDPDAICVTGRKYLNYCYCRGQEASDDAGINKECEVLGVVDPSSNHVPCDDRHYGSYKDRRKADNY
jgi:hypothetical protein